MQNSFGGGAINRASRSSIATNATHVLGRSVGQPTTGFLIDGLPKPEPHSMAACAAAISLFRDNHRPNSKFQHHWLPKAEFGNAPGASSTSSLKVW